MAYPRKAARHAGLVGLAAAATLAVNAPHAQAEPVGLIDTDRFGYTGTITRYDSLADATDGTNAVDTIAVGDRDLSLFFSVGRDAADANIALGSWWYTTDSQGRAGWGNTNGNTGVGYVQLYDVDSSTDTSLNMAFTNPDGDTYRDFEFSVAGEKADAADFARLSAVDNVNDGGVFHSYALDLVARGLAGTDDDGDGLIEALNTQPTDVTGSFSGIFEITEDQTTSANLGFYAFDFALNMTNWAYDNRESLVTQNEAGEPIPDMFAPSNFIAGAAQSVSVPSSIALLGLGLAAVGTARRRRG